MTTPNFSYLIPRLVRHFLPEQLTRFLLLRSMVIHAGLETSDPQAAVGRYVSVIDSQGRKLEGKRVMVFGYGGRFDIGVRLLQAGALHVVLCEKQAPADDAHNAGLVPEFGRFLRMDGGYVSPRAEYMTLLQGDIRQLAPAPDMPLFDLVLSNSVYEHLDDVDGITCALAALTRPDGLQIHFVDLRDHFFKYPFEMLTFSEATWRAWLDPTSHHNRFRLRDYRSVFDRNFESVSIDILARDEESFRRIQERIRPEFLSGDAADDSVTLVLITAARPRPT